MWGTRTLFSLQVVPRVMQFPFSILYAVSYFHLSDSAFGIVETAEAKRSWLSAQDKLLADISPLVLQLNLWWSGLSAKLVSFLRRLRLFSGKVWRHDLVKFITRMCKVKTQTKYLSLTLHTLSLVTLECYGLEGVLARTHRWYFISLSCCGRFMWHSSVYHKQVQTSWTVYWTIID